MDIIYHYGELENSLIRIIALLGETSNSFYEIHHDQKYKNFSFQVMKKPLDDWDSLIVILEPEGYSEKLCLKIYPRKGKYPSESENGHLALELFQNASSMKMLQDKKIISPYHLVWRDSNFMYCVYNYVEGKRLTKFISEAMSAEALKTIPNSLELMQKKFIDFHRNLYDLGFSMAFGGITLGKLSSDNIIVDSKGSWWITDLNSIEPVTSDLDLESYLCFLRQDFGFLKTYGPTSNFLGN